jgi:hypothetical protein
VLLCTIIGIETVIGTITGDLSADGKMILRSLAFHMGIYAAIEIDVTSVLEMGVGISWS